MKDVGSSSAADALHQKPALGEIYERLVGDDDARVCKGISEQACQVVPGNFVLTLTSTLLTKIGDAFIDAKTILPWLMSAMGAPAALIGLLVPIRESGSLLPQAFIAAPIRHLAVRKWAWVVGCVLQAVFVIAMALIAVSLDGATGGVALITALVGFSLARGLCSIASKDVLGKTIPKTRRGIVTGYSASAAGLVTLIAGSLVAFSEMGPEGNKHLVFLWLLGLGALMWLLAAVTFAFVREYPGATEGGGSLLSGGVKQFRMLFEDRAFRTLIVVRSLLLSSALSAPYYVALAQDHSDSSALLGLFVIATGAAGLLSGPFWGRLADVSSRKVLLITALMTGASGVAVAVLDMVWANAPGWLFVVAFFVLAITHNGVRLGRKTYVVDLAQGNKRTAYVAIGNTFIGFLLLLCGGLGALTAIVPVAVLLLVLAIAAFLAAAYATKLPEIE